MEAVDILLDRNALQHRVHRQVRGQGKLHQDAVDGDVLILLLDHRQQGLQIGRCRQRNDHRFDARVATGLGLVRHIQSGRRIVADQYYGQLRRSAVFRGQLGCLYPQRFAQMAGVLPPIDDLRA